MIVHRLNDSPAVSMAEFNASPVTIPGNAIGSTSRNETVSRPKNRKRCTANADSDPRTSAMAVAPTPALIDSHRDDRTSLLWNATANHFAVSPLGGQDCATLGLKA